ncbi:MAG TPA: hypothetical protein VHO23_01890 [Candidatus Paceibacterota bacterium]|nr:hypothetical protein [Candidatus Paceibacterota bacterium]
MPTLSPEAERTLLGGEDYEQLVIFRFVHWILYLHENQAHLGRAYAWLATRHVDLHQLHDLAAEERDELDEVMRHYRSALDALWKPDLVNCCWLGNEYGVHRGHGHMHLIPRYARPPKMLDFGRRHFDDTCFGRNYTHAPKRVLLPEELEHIRKQIEQRFT